MCSKDDPRVSTSLPLISPALSQWQTPHARRTGQPRAAKLLRWHPNRSVWEQHPSLRLAHRLCAPTEPGAATWRCPLGSGRVKISLKCKAGRSAGNAGTRLQIHIHPEGQRLRSSIATENVQEGALWLLCINHTDLVTLKLGGNC